MTLAFWTWPTWPPAELPIWGGLLLAALLGRVTLGSRRPAVWRGFWTVCLGGFWVAVTLRGLWLDRLAVGAVGSVSLGFLLTYLWRLSLALGLLRVIWLERDSESSTLSIIVSLCFAALSLGHPQAAFLTGLPLLTATGYCPALSSSSLDWSKPMGDILEMASLQTVAWTVVLTLVNPMAELAGSRYLDATFSFFATAVSGWLFSGLLWGAASTLGGFRRAEKSDPGLQVGFGIASPQIDVGESLDRDSVQT